MNGEEQTTILNCAREAVFQYSKLNKQKPKHGINIKMYF